MREGATCSAYAVLEGFPSSEHDDKSHREGLHRPFLSNYFTQRVEERNAMSTRD